MRLWIIVCSMVVSLALINALPPTACCLVLFAVAVGMYLSHIREVERLKGEAAVDPLTQLLTRAAGMPALEREHHRAVRKGQAYSLLVLDLDRFKAINDLNGHLGGDAVLRRAGQLVLMSVRKMDLAVRYGGEEILVLLPETNQEQALVLAERLRSALEAFVVFGGKRICFSASIGVAQFESGLTLTQVIERADRALYVAKNNGRNQVRCLQGQPATEALAV